MSAATDAETIASISTPVRSNAFTVLVTTTVPRSPSTSNSTAAEVSAIGWASGITSHVFFAAAIPAIRAIPSTSPFFIPPAAIAATVSFFMKTVAHATAVRRVGSFAPTSTITARPASSKWLNGIALLLSAAFHTFGCIRHVFFPLAPNRRVPQGAHFIREWGALPP